MTEKTISGTAVINDVRLSEQVGDPASEVSYWHLYAKSGGIYAINPSGSVVGPFIHSGSAYTQGARAYHSVNQSIANATGTTLSFDSERYDTDTIHNNVTNNSRLTATTAGKYMISCNIQFASNGTGHRGVHIDLNGTTSSRIASQFAPPVSGQITEINVATVYDLAASDYAEVVVYQSSGGALNVTNSGNHSPEFMMQKIG